MGSTLVYAPEHGHRFNITYAPNRYGLPTFYSLDAWILKYNRLACSRCGIPGVHCTQ